jgi:hypothetical protein
MSGEKWTRSQSIRTAWQIPVEVAITETSPPPIYQRVATEAAQLERLGLSHRKIADALRVTDKTVTKALRWLRRRTPSEW